MRPRSGRNKGMWDEVSGVGVSGKVLSKRLNGGSHDTRITDNHHKPSSHWQK